MTRWIAIFLCSIALCCSGALAFAQGLAAEPPVAAWVDAVQVASDEGQTPAELERAQPDMPCELPQLFDSRPAVLPSNAGSVALPLHGMAALSAPFIEGPQRPPRRLAATPV